MKYMLIALMVAWATTAHAQECGLNGPLFDEILEVDYEVNGFPSASYVPPEQVAAAFHKVRRIEQALGPSCRQALGVWLEDLRRTLKKALARSLEKDSFVLEGNFAILERKLDDLERRVAAAEAAGWPDGSKGALATEYAGYYQGQASELMRMYIELVRAAFRAEAADDGRRWVEETTCEAGKALVRVTPRVRDLEAKLGVGRDAREAAPRRSEPGAGPRLGDKAFDGALPSFDGGAPTVPGGVYKDIRTPPQPLDIPPPQRPRGWMR